jgi:hypothetical protein
MRARFAVTMALVLAAPLPSMAQEATYDEALADWASVLERFVDTEGRTNFAALANDRAELDRFVDYLARISPQSEPAQFPTREAVLAYHINAYNALAMHSIIETGIPDGFTSFFRRAAFFRFHKVTIDGKSTNLYDYENKVIRPLGEPRVHFALNCMVRGCPRLPQEPFRAARLDEDLSARAREFFAKPKHIRVDAQNHEVWLSEILDFYTEDFVSDGRADSLIPYVNRFRDTPIDLSYRVRFIPYDWTLNRQP